MRGFFAVAVAVALGSCGGTLAPSSADAGEESATDPRRWSFNPTKYSSTCNADSDCVLRPVVTDCLVCCTNHGAIRADISDLDFRAVEQACAGPDAPSPRGPCGSDCSPGTVACRQNDCVLVRAGR